MHLLIVDDEQDIREMLSRHFRYLGYSVDTAAHGGEALTILAQTKVDIMISDIMMPEVNGVELLRAVRNDYPMVRTIMITGYVTLDNALACLRFGADYCIFKPLTELDKLEKAVEESAQKIRYWLEVMRDLRGMKPKEQ